MFSTRRLPRFLAATAGAVGGAVLVAGPASAHVGHATEGFDHGILHPLTGPDHLLAMVAVGVVAAMWRTDRQLWLAPIAFVAGMALGGTAGLAGLPLPGAEILIALSVVLLGVAMATALTADPRWVLPLLAIAGVTHGHAHGAEAPATAHPALFVVGFLLATATLHLAGVGVGTLVRERRLAQVGLGMATATAGALLLLGGA